MTDIRFRDMTQGATDRRLGRNVKHDPRSLNYLVQPQPTSTLVTVKHEVFIPVLDQGNLGSCTGNAGTGWLGTLANRPEGLDEDYAVALYSDATKADDYQGDYPPSDTGSDGLSIAKVLQARGLIGDYLHATSLEATLTALQSQAVIAGIPWHGDSFNPDMYGRIPITGDVEGGHEILLTGVDVENRLINMRNSWGPGWGVGGEGYFTWDDFEALLAQEGDVTVMHDITIPAAS